ncbi:peptidoglycan DD-metalloendopeptidase family protein [Desulforhopalus sp. 52FAK]
MRSSILFITFFALTTLMASCAKITSIQPNPTVPGANVTIKGWGFGTAQNNSQILYDDSELTANFWSSRKIITQITDGQRVGNFDLKLTLKNGKKLSSNLAIECAPPECRSILLPPSGGEISLPGVIVRFYDYAFPSNRQVRAEITENPGTDILFKSLAGYLTTAARISNEIRINTGETPPLNSKVTVSLSVPHRHFKALPPRSTIIPFVQVDDFTDTELKTSFIAIKPTDKVDTANDKVKLNFDLSKDFFTQSPDGSYEAIIILAPTYNIDEVSNVKTTSTCQSVQIRAPLLGSPNVTDPFDPTAGHRGVDFAVANGTTVVAVADGKVVSSPGSPGNPQIRQCYQNETRCTALGLTHRGAGNFIIIKHGTGDTSRYTTYFHLSDDSNFPAMGSSVSKGQALGLSDSTGGVTGPHLHFEYRKARFGEHIDPEPCFDCTGCIEKYVEMLPNGCPNDPPNYRSFGVTNSCESDEYMHYHCFNPSDSNPCKGKCGPHLVAWFCRTGQTCQGNGCSPSCSGGESYRIHKAPCP